MAASTHRVEVVPVALRPHPNADSLSIVSIFGYQVVVRTDDWRDRPIGAYIVPDSVVPDTEAFAFLNGQNRIRVRKFRGVMSQGLLVPAPEGSAIGDDVAAVLGVTRYEPPEPGGKDASHGIYLGGEAAPSPPGCYPKYDVESWYRYSDALVPGEHVFITEKIHGCNARFVFADGRMHCGSRTEWKREYPSFDHLTIESLAPKVGEEKAREIIDRVKNKPQRRNLWWQALDQCPELRSWCEANPGICVYGEVFGQVQDLKYGAIKGQLFFCAFDLLRAGEWVPHVEARIIGAMLPWVPELYSGPYDPAAAKALADGKTTFPGANNVREGVVVKPAIERWSSDCGRVQLKIVSDAYLERAA